MLNLIQSAANKERNASYSFYLDGDLSQMSNQKQFLVKNGFDVKQNDVYPCLKQEDVKSALELIWNNRVDGWWHYSKKYVEHNICTEEEFRNRLNRS